MKKLISMVALAAICLGTVTAAVPVKAQMDTTKKDSSKKKMKKMKKMKKDTTKM